MSVEQALDRVHGRVRSSRALRLFTWFTRISLALGFVPSGLKKILGEPFTGTKMYKRVGIHASISTTPRSAW